MGNILLPKPLILGAMGLCLAGGSAVAKEGMWTPAQLPGIAEDLRQTGLEISPESMTDLNGFPLGAVISLGGCSASFVSPEGLVVTNHHCARGSIQFNSTADENFLETGFLAATREDERPAAPGTRVYVTVGFSDVTDNIRGALTPDMTGEAASAAIEAGKKSLIAECESRPGHRCQVAAFFGGLEYSLVDRLEIRDVRLVYGPGDNIGRYGGDIDNWMWPRHTGDWSFYRAYVGRDGAPADFDPENVPFQPEHYLKVSASGLDEGDFVMVAGYPGSTQRYARLTEVEHVFGWLYPHIVSFYSDWIDVIEQAAPKGSEARIRYEGRLAGLNNTLKNLGGQLEGARRVGLLERRAQREKALADWVKGQDAGSSFTGALAALDTLTQETAEATREDWGYNNATRAQLLGAAQRLYRLSLERQKPDAQREPGYQDRDMVFFRQGLEAMGRRYDRAVDKAEWMFFLREYMTRSEADRVSAFDAALGLPREWDAEIVSTLIASYYEETELEDAALRLSLMDQPPAFFEASEDPFIRLAVALAEHERAIEIRQKGHDGEMAQLRPEYMRAIVAWQASRDRSAYPDANSTLRITYGTVQGGAPRDGLFYAPFTTLEGLAAKDTGLEPFNAPKRQLELIEAADYGGYELTSLGSVPVNFLSDLDTTGGNSGSPTLNGRGEFVGLLFDGTIESVNSDWDFDPRTTRSIHVDSRYMLWVMEKVDGAEHLLSEMDIVR